MVDHTMTTCPACGGRTGTHGFAYRVEGCNGIEWVSCTLCRGDGSVTVSRAQVYERGKKIHDARMLKDITLREFATSLGLKPSDVSDIENGRSLDEFMHRAEVLLGLRNDDPKTPLDG